MGTGTDSQPDDSILEIGGIRIAPGDRIGNFVYRRRIGSGGMAHVLLAIDPDGRSSALKVLKSTQVGSGYQRFLREFKALSRLRHPNVIRVDALGSLHGHPYIAMEYVDGHDLHHAIHTFRLLGVEERWRRCEEILVDLCRALAYIHRRGLIHRDLKPSNVLLEHDRQCKLTDFGIVKDLDPDADPALSTTLVGTWAYASPEQIQGQPIDHRSDLYSLGVILFAMLTGRRPFVARDLAGYLELHRTHVAPAPRDLDPSIPAHLDEICVRLLRKHARDRFRSAQEILYHLEQLEVESESVEGVPWDPPLLGRSAEEETLRGRTAALTRGQAGAVWIEGEEGTGKTRLLDIAAHQAELMGFATHRVRADERDGPFGPILRLAAAVQRHLPGAAGAPIADALAEWAQDGGARPQARERVYAALADGLARLLDEGPQVLLVDDLHHAQLPTLDALTWLLRRFVHPDGPSLLVVGAWRPDRVGVRLAGLRDGAASASVTTLRLGALTPAVVADLTHSLLGPGRAAEALAERLSRESEGNPLYLVAYLQSLMAHGVIVRSTGGWRVTADAEELATGHMDVPGPVRQVVHARLDAVEDRERPMLEVLAVSGRETEIDVLLDVLDLDEDAGNDCAETLIGLGLARQRRTGERYFLEFTRAKYAEVVYRDLDPERRADLHRRIAATLELRYAHAPSAAEAVGEHYRRAGEVGKAFQHLTAAARRARDKGQYTEAWELATRAHGADDPARVDLPPREYAAIKHILLQVRADILFHRTEWQEAREVLEDAIALLGKGPDEASSLRTRIHYGRVLRVLGDLDRAEAEVRGSLEHARELHDREAVAEGVLVLAGIAWGRGQLDRCAQYAQEGLVLATGPGMSGARAHLLLALTAVQANRGELASAAAGLHEAQQLLRVLKMRTARLLALANLAEVLLGQGEPGTAWEYATDALQEAEDAGHRLGESAARGIRGLAAMRAGMFEEARAEFDAALAAARALGVASELTVPAWQLARLDLEEGDLESALTHLDVAADSARLGDPEHYAPAVDILRAQIHACTDAADTALALVSRVDARLDQLPMLRRVQVLLDLSEAWRLLGQPALALARARDASVLASRRGFRLHHLDALLLLGRLETDPLQSATLREHARALARDLSAAMPAGWQASFLRKLDLGAA